METVDFLVIGAGVSGLGFANWVRERDAGAKVLVCEADDEPGGYCRTVVQDGFVWDYSGHFFHFRHPEIEAWLRARMPPGPDGDVRTVARVAKIRFAGGDVDFPFQKNIHQLPREDFIDCLHDLYFRTEAPADESFKSMLYARYGRGIAERFLIPYNEKLYATDLAALDRDAMGRFFPHADVADIIRNMKAAPGTAAGYNATFTYPAGGAIQYIRALLRDLPADSVACGERVVSIDLASRTARTTKREVAWGRIVSSAPLPALARACAIGIDEPAFSWNSVLVYNLGFDRKGRGDVHWMYFPDRARSFYRVGWYDNILGADRMSLYVELGAPAGTVHDAAAGLPRVLADLEAEGIVRGHQLVSWHSVVLDPAYVHINRRSLIETERVRVALGAAGVHSVGRYGGWTYCSIEDNLVETRTLAATF